MDFVSKVFSSLKQALVSVRTGSVLGLDIGTSTIKVVQLRKEKEWAVLETYGELALAPYMNLEVGRAVKLPKEKLVEAIKDLLKEANIKARRTAISIPLKSSFVTVIKVPMLSDKELGEVIKLEARKYIPVPISEVVIDWWIFPEEESQIEESESENDSNNDKKDERSFVKVLLVAIHRDTITERKEVASSAGLQISSLELESFSMIRSSLSRESAPIAIIDLGASTSKVAIVDIGIMRASYAVNKGSQDLTLAMSNSLGIDFKRAEEMKREIGISDLPEHKEISDIMETILEHIFSEIRTVIKNYQLKNKQAVARAILTGGGSMLKGINDLAVKNLNMEVSVSEPFLKTEFPMFLEETLKQGGLSFSIAVGLALRELQ